MGYKTKNQTNEMIARPENSLKTNYWMGLESADLCRCRTASPLRSGAGGLQ